jgi:probable F420-dependent oxidoreductase
MPLLIGAKLPHTGAIPPASVPRAAQVLDGAGFDSIWVSDHVVLPERMDSHYPFAADGRATWPTDTPYLEALTVLAAAAAVTDRARLGTAVLVVPQRNPLLTAKQLGTVAALSAGRLTVGVGAGWLREEFEALDAPFDGRGAAMEDWVGIFRETWTGHLEPRTGRYSIPAPLHALPTPPEPIPVLVGGHSPRALARAGRWGDGWLGQQAVPDIDTDTLAREIDAIAASATAAGRDPAVLSHVLRLVESAGRHRELAARLPELAAAGVTEIIVDLDLADAPEVHQVLAEAAA